MHQCRSTNSLLSTKFSLSRSSIQTNPFRGHDVVVPLNDVSREIVISYFAQVKAMTVERCFDANKQEEEEVVQQLFLTGPSICH